MLCLCFFSPTTSTSWYYTYCTCRHTSTFDTIHPCIGNVILFVSWKWYTKRNDAACFVCGSTNRPCHSTPLHSRLVSTNWHRRFFFGRVFPSSSSRSHRHHKMRVLLYCRSPFSLFHTLIFFFIPVSWTHPLLLLLVASLLSITYSTFSGRQDVSSARSCCCSVWTFETLIPGRVARHNE